MERDGKKFVQVFHRGIPEGPATAVGKSSRRGTTIRSHPDDSMFTTVIFDAHAVVTRLRQQAYLTRGITLTFRDERIGYVSRFYLKVVFGHMFRISIRTMTLSVRSIISTRI